MNLIYKLFRFSSFEYGFIWEIQHWKIEEGGKGKNSHRISEILKTLLISQEIIASSIIHLNNKWKSHLAQQRQFAFAFGGQNIDDVEVYCIIDGEGSSHQLVEGSSNKLYNMLSCSNITGCVDDNLMGNIRCAWTQLLQKKLPSHQRPLSPWVIHSHVIKFI